MLQQTGINKVAFCVVTAAFVFATFFGASHIGIDAQMGGQMGPCPLMPGVVICNMTPLQHMAAAQIMFTALPQSSDFFALLLLLLASVVAAALLRRMFFPPSQLASPCRFVSRKEHVPFSPLLEAFSNVEQ